MMKAYQSELMEDPLARTPARGKVPLTNRPTGHERNGTDMSEASHSTWAQVMEKAGVSPQEAAYIYTKSLFPNSLLSIDDFDENGTPL